MIQQPAFSFDIRRAIILAVVILAAVAGFATEGGAAGNPPQVQAQKAKVLWPSSFRPWTLRRAGHSSRVHKSPGIWRARVRPKPTPPAPPSPAVPSPGVPDEVSPVLRGQDRYGVSPDNIEFDDPATRNQILDSLVEMGARWIRFDVKWQVIQYHGPTSFDWSRYDALTNAATQRGLKILGTLAFAPQWARSAECPTNFMCKPRDPQEYARWAEATVSHFKGRISHWEIWNEANISVFFQPRPDVALYTELLRAAYPRIKAADPQALVIAGATAPAPNEAQRIDEVTFLQGVYENGGRGFFDAWSHHPYTHPSIPGNVHPDSAWWQMYGASPNLRGVMTANGDREKQIWGTEYGPPTSGAPGAVTESVQAQTVTDAYRLWRTYQWAGPLFWYCDRDVDPLGASTEGWRYHGLMRYDLSRKPSWAAYRTSASTPG